MISRALTTVLLTGFVAGILYTGAQMLRVTPLILEAEKYEIAEIAVPHSHGASGIKHVHVLNGVALDVHQRVATPHEILPTAHDHAGVAHDHAKESWAPGDGAERTFYTAVSNIVTGIAFSLMLVAVYLLRGKTVDMNSGLLWGAAGFAVFALAPALGLPPELPGMTTAALESRQVWWIGTVIATAIGIGLFTESKSILPKIAALVLLMAPHFIGAPHPFLFESNVPAELSAQFAVASLVTSAFLWLVLGATSGYFYKKLVLESSGALAAATA
ncbi:MAG: CbtA family protein [SAR324 cluster bacterium]|nr:CbtA family protein [SAR324 cluster bacterium]